LIDLNDKRLQQFGYLGLRARQVVEGFITGLHKSPFHGFSVEFSEHRAYNPGESIRHIDWKLFGKTEKLFVKRYEEETNLRCRLIVDGSASMLFPNIKSRPEEMQSKYQFSIFLSAVFMYLFRLQRDAVGLSIVTDKLEEHTNAKSTFIHHQFLMNILQNHLSTLPEKEAAQSVLIPNLHQIAERIHKRSMVIIMTDLFDVNHDAKEVLNALQHFKHNGHEVILFHILDRKWEEHFDYDNRPYRFIDLEDKSTIKVRPAEIRDLYQKKFAELTHDIKEQCPKYGVDYVEADIQDGLEKTLLGFFAKRAVKTGRT
jgi:uncharacterized protein (DUF58 family)